MICVIDTSAIVAVLLSEPERAMLVRVTRGAELVAPASVHWEIGNALSAGLKRRRLTLAEGQRALTAYAAIPIRFVDVDLALLVRGKRPHHQAKASRLSLAGVGGDARCFLHFIEPHVELPGRIAAPDLDGHSLARC